MSNETVSRDELSANYINKIKQANAEIRALSRYFEPVSDTNMTVLEKYLEDLQKHPAASDPDHNDYQTINKKIESVRFNLNLIPLPEGYPAQQKSYTDRYLAAKAMLEEYAKQTKELDALHQDTQNIQLKPTFAETTENIGQCVKLPVIAAQDFASSSPKIIASDKTIPQGGEILFTLDAVYQDINHFWLFGNYNAEDRQLSRTDYFVVNTSGLEIGKQYRVRATLTSKLREQKYLQAFFEVTKAEDEQPNQQETAQETAQKISQAPLILPSNPTIIQGESISFTVDTAGLDIIHYYWLSGNIRKGGTDKFEIDTTDLELGSHEVKVSLTLRDRSQDPKLISTAFTIKAAPVIPSFDDVAIELQQQSQNVELQALFIGQERGFYSWVVDSFTSTFREVRNGINISQLTLNELQTGKYRARLSISYQGVTRRLEKRFEVALTNHDEQQAVTLQSRDDFIAETASIFAGTGNLNQDMAHDAILRYLLSSTYSEQYIGSNDTKRQAYYAVRTRDGQDHISHPLYLVRSREDLNNLTSADFFIRDFIQLQGRGGTEGSPYVIGDIDSVGEQRNGLSIIDGAVNSEFANDFNTLVEAINETDLVQQRSGRVKFFTKIAHRDAIQLAPYAGDVSQFAGVTMRNVIINGNTIASDGALQGIFATDGTFQNLNITNNSIQTEGAHTISISGMLSGKIEGNTDLQGKSLPANNITLYPLRIGGGANIYVMSFRNAEGVKQGDPEYYAYEEIKGDQQINDRRNKKDRANASYWKNVDLPALQTLFSETFAHVKQLGINKNKALAQLREENKPYIDIRTVADEYQASINEAWDSMMLQVAERDEE